MDKTKRYPAVLVLLLLLCGGAQAQAEARYVTDQFKIMMRSGEGVSHKILKALPSGTPLTLLESNRETGYSKVRTESGLEGYVLTRQLMKQPSARDRLAEAERRLKAALEEPERLNDELAVTRSKLEALTRDFSELQQTKNRIAAELESIRRTAADAIQMAEERITLRKRVADLTHQIENLKQENRDLSNQSTRDWFLIGAAVIVAGILIGLILPRLHVQRRKDSWGSL